MSRDQRHFLALQLALGPAVLGSYVFGFAFWPDAVAATFAGYYVVLAMAQIGVPSLVWREVFACLGAVFVGGTAWTRLTIFTEPRPVEPRRAIGDGPQPVLAAATREG